MKYVAVIGAGTMGNGIAHVFAQFGHPVALIDTSAPALQRATDTIAKNLDRQVAKGLLTEADGQATRQRITTFTQLDEGAAAQLVVEAASENPEVKTLIFSQLDSICSPETILATNTSSISITRMAAATQRPDRVIGMHFMNPVPVMKLVEVIRGYATSDATTATVMQLAAGLQKTPVEVNDYPGFIANRILMPMINEAISSLYEGVAGVAEIDTVMKLGMAHPMGPLQLADFIGLDICQSILEVMYQGFGNPKYAPCPLLVNMVRAGHLGVKTGRGFYEYQGKEATVAPRFR
jgi:3-hydroxybutyryl-CoA dehydrogenase